MAFSSRKLPLSALLSLGILGAALSPSLPATAAVTPNPVISRNAPAYASLGNGSAANDDDYSGDWYGNLPAVLTYDLSGVPEAQRQQVLAIWSNSTYQYDMVVLDSQSFNMPKDYTISLNAAPGGECPETGWETAVDVTDNTCHSRQHVIDFEGFNWIRLTITSSYPVGGNSVGLSFDVHSCTDGVADSWLFLGDSITAGGMVQYAGDSFAQCIHALDDRYFPAAENGGIGGIFSTDGAANIDRWLTQFPGQFVGIAYGTNDAWGNQTGAEQYYKNLEAMVQAVLAAGKTPVVPKIPFSLNPDLQANVPAYNAQVTALYEAYPAVVPGSDFEAMFEASPTLLSPDGVHPSNEGYAAMRKLWAQTMYASVYEKESSSIMGDANGDGVVNMQDVVTLSAHLVRRAPITDPALLQNLDLDQSGHVNALDLSLLKSKLLLS